MLGRLFRYIDLIYAELFLGVGDHGGAVGGGDVGAIDVFEVFAVDYVTDVAFVAIEVIGIARKLDIHTGIEEHCGILYIMPIIDDAVEGVIRYLDVLRGVDRDGIPLLVICEFTAIKPQILDREGIVGCDLARSGDVDSGSADIAEAVIENTAMVEEATLDVDITRYSALAPARLDRYKQTHTAYVLEGAVLDVYVGSLHEIAS